MYEIHRKSFIQHSERSELRLHFEWTKVHWKCQKWSGKFLKPKACDQTEFPDRSVLIGQKLVENARIKKIQIRHFEEFSNTVLWCLELIVLNPSFLISQPPFEIKIAKVRKVPYAICGTDVVHQRLENDFTSLDWPPKMKNYGVNRFLLLANNNLKVWNHSSWKLYIQDANNHH